MNSLLLAGAQWAPISGGPWPSQGTAAASGAGSSNYTTLATGRLTTTNGGTLAGDWTNLGSLSFTNTNTIGTLGTTIQMGYGGVLRFGPRNANGDGTFILKDSLNEFLYGTNSILFGAQRGGAANTTAYMVYDGTNLFGDNGASYLGFGNSVYPAPSVWTDRIYGTASNYFFAAHGTNVLFVHPSGQTTGIRGDPTHPWSSFTNALLSATNGDVIDGLNSTNIIAIAGASATDLASSRSTANIGRMTNFTIRNISLLVTNVTTAASFSNKGNMLVAWNTENLSFDNVTFQWKIPGYASKPTNPVFSVFSAVQLFGTNSNPRFNNCRFLNLPDQAIMPSAFTDGVIYTSGLDVRNCYFDDIGGNLPGASADGTAVSFGSNAKLLDNVFTNCFRMGEFYGLAGSITNVEVARNQIHTLESGILFLPASGALNISDITIEENKFYASSNGNTAINPSGSNIFMLANRFYGGNYHISGNGTNFTIAGNHFYNWTSRAIASDGGGPPNLGWKISGNTADYGPIAFDLAYFNNGLVSDNVLMNCTDPRAIDVRSTTGINLTGNVQHGAKYSQQAGVLIAATVTNARLSGNFFLSNTIPGGVSNLGVNTIITDHFVDTNRTMIAPGLSQSNTALFATNFMVVGLTNTGATLLSDHVAIASDVTNVNAIYYAPLQLAQSTNLAFDLATNAVQTMTCNTTNIAVYLTNSPTGANHALQLIGTNAQINVILVGANWGLPAYRLMSGAVTNILTTNKSMTISVTSFGATTNNSQVSIAIEP